MKDAIRFSHVFLESFFKRILDDGYASDKAFIVLGCAQVATVFSLFNMLVVLGAKLPKPNFGFGLAFLLSLLLLFANYRIIYGDGELESYRKRYQQIPKTRRLLGGMAVLALVVLSIATLIVTTGMAAPFRVD